MQGKLLRLKMYVCLVNYGSSSLDEVSNEKKRPNLHTVIMPYFQYFLENLLNCPSRKVKFMSLERECEIVMKYSLYIVTRTFTRRGKFCLQNCFSFELVSLIICMN